MKPLLIDGAWVTTSHGLENANPSDTGDVIDIFAQGGKAEAQSALAAAANAFPEWSMSTPQLRHDILKTAGDEILARQQEIGTLLSREEGKTLAEGVAETVRAGQIFLFFAGEAVRQTGDHVPSVRPEIDVTVTREPTGVVGIITPWNFPMAIPAWKIAPALCFGNCVVFKPAELVPGCAWTIVDILHRAGLPPGVLNLVFGPGSVVGQAMLDDPLLDAMTFTGSVETGERVASACVKHMRKFQLEMGGKNPLVVLDDADLDVAVECAVNGAYYSTGQRCTASSRLIVTEGIHNRFVEAVCERIRTLKVDHALKPETQIGPVVDEHQLRKGLRLYRHRSVAGRQCADRGTGSQSGHKRSFSGTRAYHRHDTRDADQQGRSVRSCSRPSCACGTTTRRFPSPMIRNLACRPVFAQQASNTQRISGGIPSSGLVMVNLPTAGCGLPRANGWSEAIQLWTERTGTIRERVLHHCQNGLYPALNGLREARLKIAQRNRKSFSSARRVLPLDGNEAHNCRITYTLVRRRSAQRYWEENMSHAISVCHGEFGRAALYRLNKTIITHAHREGHLIFYVDGLTANVRGGRKILSE